MQLFSTISIETSSKCNRKCWFCPNATNSRPVEYMPMPLIDSILANLVELNYAGRVEFYIYNEPLLDPRIYDIVGKFRAALPKACLMLATNADKVILPKQFQLLFHNGLNQLQINVYSDARRYRELARFLRQTDGVEGNVYVRLSPNSHVYSLEKKFERLVTPETPKIGKFELQNRSGNVPALPELIEPLCNMCVRPFRYAQINWKGEVILCCNDYHGEVVCGNTNTETIESIWYTSTTLEFHRSKLLQKDRSGLKLCAPCSFKGGAYPHFIPKFWPELMPK